MANLYLWFPNNEERRKFLLELLEIKPLKPKNKGKKAIKETEGLQYELDVYLENLESGKTKSFYYELHKEYYNGITPNLPGEPAPWTPLAVFNKGFRRIYTQKSYAFRPGYWLVLQFRKNKNGWEKRNWVLQKIPQERLGLNVPLSPEVILKRKLDHVERILDGVTYNEVEGISTRGLELSLKILNEVKESKPDLFVGEKSYLWETLSYAYYHMGNLKMAEYCLRTQATFQPGEADAYLNLGSFYADYGMWGPAIAAYLDGLKVNPKDEFIYYNLASLYSDTGNREAALNAINDAILENPEKGINYKFKGDMHLDYGEYQWAVSAYEEAVKLFSEGWEDDKLEAYCNMAEAQKEMGQQEKALTNLEKAHELDKENISVSLHLAHLWGKELRDFSKGIKYAEEALKHDPSCAQACFLLSQYYEKSGERKKAKWYLKRGKKEEGGSL